MKPFFTSVILIAALTLSQLDARSQCNLVVTPTEVCAGEPITAIITNPNPNYDHQILINGTPHLGDSVVYIPQGTGSEYIINFIPMRKGFLGGFTSCGTPRQVTVLETPDASLDFNGATMNGAGAVVNCNGNPTGDFEVTVSNASSTAETNTSYHIDWGDGSPTYSGADLPDMTHTYEVGYFELTITVAGQGDAGCSPASYTYIIFNGSSPTVGIEDPMNFIGSQNLCPPVLAEFDIVNAMDNVVGTTYEIKIDGEVVMEFPHPPPASFEWEFLETSCGHTASNGVENTYDVTIQAYNPCPGPPDFATLGPIIIGDTVSPDFSYNPDPICKDEVITFTNTTQGTLDALTCSNIQYVVWTIEPATGWTLVSGDMEWDDEIEVIFDEIGEYEVTVEAMNSCDTLDKMKPILVLEEPEADAAAELDHPDGCAPTIATFENYSTVDTVVTYNWSVFPSGGVSFVNGTNPSDFEPEIQFNNQGNYLVSLTVSNDCGSPTWDTTLVIRKQPFFNLPELDNICAYNYTFNSNVNFGANPDSVIWTFNGGVPSSFVGENPPAIEFNGTGDYSIEVSAYNICGVTTHIEEFELSEPVDIDAGEDETLCFDNDLFALSGSPSGGTWSGNGVSGNTFNPSAVQQDVVTLTYTFDNGICNFTDTKDITIVRIDNLTAGTDQSICINQQQLTLEGASPAGGEWIGDAVTNASGIFDPSLGTIGDNVVGYVYTEPTLGCDDTVYKTVTILDIPVIDVEFVDTVCVNSSTSFSQADIPGSIVNWSFGDGHSTTGGQVEHTFETAGQYWVVAEVLASGCYNRDSVLITVIEVPEPIFEMSSSFGCNQQAIDFDNQTTGHVDSVLWDFGNGLTSTNWSPQQINFQPGTFYDTAYHITLTIYNDCGESNVSDSIFITKPPVARFGTDFNFYCPGQPVHFNNASFNSPDTFWWDFGNGNTSTEKNPGAQYYDTPVNDTIYVVTMVAYNECGRDTMQNEILIKTVNVISFFNTNPPSGCSPLNVEFINFSSFGSTPIWDFDDGNFSTRDTVEHIFYDAGTYNVMLAVDNGCSQDTSYVEITVIESPHVEFTAPDESCQYSSVQFTNQSQGAFDYQWDFGDGNTSILTNPYHEFESNGTFDVTLEARNQYDCTASFTRSVNIQEAPFADFDSELNNLCGGESVRFINLSEAGENFLWDFGDGTISYEREPVKTYHEPGNYDVKLTANINNFCFDSIVKPDLVEVFAVPTAGFTYEQTTVGIIYGEVEFTNQSTDAQNYVWSFGDDESSDEIDPIHQYSNSGMYNVQLVAGNDFECYDTIIRPIDVEFFGNLFVPNAFSPILGDQSGASVFLPKGVALVDYEMEIYSSYGELLFRTTALLDGQPAEGWNGIYNGNTLPQDVYIWKIRALFDNGLSWEGMDVGDGVRTTVGTLTLIR